MFKVYQNLLNKYPVTCQSVQTGLLMGFGDFLAQTAVEKKPVKELDKARTLKFASIGGFMVGPLVSTWYKFMEKNVKPQKGRGSGRGEALVALKKVALDQLLSAPIGLATILITLSALKGHDIDGIKADVGSQYWDVLTTNYKVWPAVQLVNFYLLPLKYQLLFVQVIAIFWNIYLSTRTHN